MMTHELAHSKTHTPSPTARPFPIKKLGPKLPPCVGENSFPKKWAPRPQNHTHLDDVRKHEFSKLRFAMFRWVFEEASGHVSSTKEILTIFKTFKCQKLKISRKNQWFSWKSKIFKLEQSFWVFNGKHTAMRAFDSCRSRPLTPKTRWKKRVLSFLA